jgi:hypothetical protein
MTMITDDLWFEQIMQSNIVSCWYIWKRLEISVIVGKKETKPQ